MGRTALQRLPARDDKKSWTAQQLAVLLFAWRDAAHPRIAAAATSTALLLAAATLLVHHTGGTQFVYVHLIYLPILVGGFFFGPVGGIAAGFVAGLCVGPWMPLDVAEAIPQSTFNWTARTGFFMLVGALAGALSASLAQQIDMVRRHGHRDPLTGLPNRAQLLQTVDAALADGRDGERPVVMLALSLSYFDSVVTTLGHRHADALLRMVTARLTDLLADEPLYDLGGGSFAVLLTDGDYDSAVTLVQRMKQTLDHPMVIEGVPVLTGSQYGVARSPHHGTDGLALLRASIAALGEATQLGLPYAIYDDRSDQVRREVARLLPDLHGALRKTDELSLHYQPKILLESGRCAGVEALIRWNHPERGSVPPARFIELAERTALIGALTNWVIDTALRQLAAWKRQGIDLSIAVNVSMRNVEDVEFATRLADRLRFHGVEPARLEVEITESAFMAAPEAALRSLTAIRQLGVPVAIDDFGTGHSALSYLRDLPADSLKLDQSFLRDLRTDRRTRLLLHSAIETAHRLGFKVVGEGIADGASYACLRELGCDLGQGFHIAPPLPEPELRHWLSRPALLAPAPDDAKGLSLPPVP